MSPQSSGAETRQRSIGLLNRRDPSLFQIQRPPRSDPRQVPEQRIDRGSVGTESIGKDRSLKIELIHRTRLNDGGHQDHLAQRRQVEQSSVRHTTVDANHLLAVAN